MTQAFHGGDLAYAAQRFGRPPEALIDFSANINPLAPEIPQSSWLAWQPQAARYPEARAERIRERLAEVYGVPASRLQPTAGAIEGLYLVARLVTQTHVAVIEPGFSDYSRALSGAGASFDRITLPPDEWHAPLSGLRDRLEPYEAIILGNPNNPTGAWHPKRSWQELLSWPESSGKIVVVDEAFIEFVPEPDEESLIGLLSEHPSLIILRSLTKSWGIPGLRLGFVATGDPQRLDRIRQMQSPWSISPVATAWATELLTPSHYRELKRRMGVLRSWHEQFAARLRAIPGIVPYPSAANFLLVELTDPALDAEGVEWELGKRGLVIRRADSFHGMPAGRFIRLAVRRPEENEQLAQALTDVVGAGSRSRSGAPETGKAGQATPHIGPSGDPIRQNRRKAPLKAIAILGTSSNSGKSWVATALCAWLSRHGVRVAPFKAQNMSNNSYVTLDGGEIGRAQAVQAEACGRTPSTWMNPILLKPSGNLGSQLVVHGTARRHLKASEYYREVPELWSVVEESLEYWREQCDLLILEGAGSPVELNLMGRDLVNLRPIQALDGRWLLTADIERGGVFAQVVGTWQLMAVADRQRALGTIINKFRGDPALFDGAGTHLSRYCSLPYLGLLPYHPDLQPESEDSLSPPFQDQPGAGDRLVWIRLPNLSNSQDAQPWLADEGVRLVWATTPNELRSAHAIVLPGSKNTIADLRWMRENGLAGEVLQAAQNGIPIVGLCGGYQMLGQSLRDVDGVAGEAGDAEGLGLLPIETVFGASKSVHQVRARWGPDTWMAYEIHMGMTRSLKEVSPLLDVEAEGSWRAEGIRAANVWGTYLHGLFESRAVRSDLAELAGMSHYRPGERTWSDRKQALYQQMADCFEQSIHWQPIWNYVVD